MLKTAMLLAAMTALFMAVGYVMAGPNGMVIALLFACATNFLTYWFSDRMVLSMYRAQPLSTEDNPDLHAMVAQLAARAGIPAPRSYIIDSPQPNAFATGRSPAHASIAMTTGLLQLLERREVAAVLAHELGHVKNRDTLTMTVTATLAGAIGMLANVFMLFGGGRHGDSRPNPLMQIMVMILAPLAAMLVQMAISRTREYGADASGAEISGDPLALASALRKISGAARRIPNTLAESNPATAHLFIINPLRGSGMDNLFSTHPNAENRIRELEAMAGKVGSPPPEQEVEVAPPVRIARRGSFHF